MGERIALVGAVVLACLCAIVPGAMADEGCPAGEEESVEIGCIRSVYPEPVTSLRLIVRNHRGRSYRHPGYTAVELVSTPEAAYETLTLGYLRPPHQRSTSRWLTSRDESQRLTIPWSCSSPGTGYELIATARASVGETVTATAHYREWLTAKWCASAKEAEEQARRRALERTAENERRSAEAERHRIEAERHHWEANCRAVGGSPVVIDNGTKLVCRSQSGGIIAVPE